MKKIVLFFLVLLSFSNTLKAQSDTTEINQSGYFLTFVKKVYLNPTVYLRTQDFKENTNLSFVALPDLSSDKTNASSGFEKGLQKVLRFLMQSDGGVRFYFNPDSTTHPFRFWYSDNLHCKFKQADKDSIDYYLNYNFADGNISMTNALRFETTIDKALDYIEKCLTANPQACGEEPQNETTEINTKPLSVSLHNRANSKYDIDVKQYEKLESNYAKAFDVHTQQDWYAPAKLLVSNETAEPVALAIHSNEGDFLKQNIKIEILKTHALIPIDQASTEDSLFFSLPNTLPPGDPVEVIVKYKSPKDSATYTVGFFMVNVMERETKNLVLIPANGFVISNNFKDSVETELAKIYGQASVDFNVTIETGLVFPSEYPTSIEIESSGLFSNYAPDMRDYVGDVQDLETYEEDNYYLVIGLENSELQGYMPRARNIGFIFKSAVNKPKVIAHEIGHGAFHFRHIFAEEELGEEEQGQTKNIMDYVSNPKDLYLHQWNFIKDPAFVSWFGGDDEDAQITSCDISLLEPFKINNRFNFIKNNGKYISLPSTIKSVSFSTMDRYVIAGTDLQSDYVAPIGAMVWFIDQNGIKYSNKGDGNFYDENNVRFNEDLQNYDSINYAITCFIDVDLSTNELFPIFFNAPSIHKVGKNEFPAGIDTEISPVIFGLGSSSSFVNDFMSFNSQFYISTAREGMASGNLNYIRGNAVTFSSDEIPFKFYRGSEYNLEGIVQPPIEIEFKDFKINHLFPYKMNYTNEEIIRYLTIKSIRKSELKAIAHCIQSETFEDSKISLAILENLNVSCTTCTSQKSKINEIRTRTVFTMINQAFAESSNVTSTLEQMITEDKTASELAEYISGIETCDMYGITWETRRKVLNKIIYDDGSWNVNGKSIMAMLIKTCVDDDGSKLLYFFKEDNFSRFSQIIVEIDEWLDWNDAADVRDGMTAMEYLTRHVIKHKDKFKQSGNFFTFSKTAYSTITINSANNLFPPNTISFPDKTYDFEFPVVEIPMVLGANPNVKLNLPDIDFGDKYYGSVGGYELLTKANQTKYPITWDATTGTFKVIQNFTVSEKLVGPVFCVPGTQFPDIEIYSVNLDYTLQPYDLIDVIVGDNYGALDLPKGTVMQLPVITAFFLQESIRDNNFSANFRLVFNLVEIGAAIITVVTAPITLGGSLVVFAGVMASVDMAIQNERNNVATAAEYYSDYYKTWDNIKMISDLAMGATAVYQLGKYALKQGRSFVVAIAINRAVRNTKLPTNFASMTANSKNFTKRIIFAVQKGIYFENTFQLVNTATDQWLMWSQYPKVVLNGEEFAVVGSKFFSRAAVESMVPSGLGGSGIPPSVINNVLLNGESLASSGKIRYNLGNVFIWTESNSTIVRTIRVNKVNSISDLTTNPHSIFGYLDTDLHGLLTQSGWTKGSYGGTSDAVLYFKETNAGRSEIVFNYGGGMHSGGGTISNSPLYYKLEGPEFGRRIRIIDRQTYPATEFQKAINEETFKLVDGVTGEIYKP